MLFILCEAAGCGCEELLRVCSGRFTKVYIPSLAHSLFNFNAVGSDLLVEDYSGLGTVQACNRVALKTRVAPEILAICFREGPDVTAGQLLARIKLRIVIFNQRLTLHTTPHVCLYLSFPCPSCRARAVPPDRRITIRNGSPRILHSPL